jgi:hypothetical protein
MKIRVCEQHSALGEAFRRRRLPWLRVSLGVVVGLVAAMTFALPKTVFARVADPSPTIRVRVDNYTQASHNILAAAEREASRIFAKAGLTVVWLNCLPEHSIVVPQDPCQEALEAKVISLRVLPTPLRNVFQDTVFGFAVHPVLASVYYDHVLLLAKRDMAEFEEVRVILGCVIAHEIGHLLLGSNSHSSSGIMRSRWEPKQIRQALTGTLLFTPEQAKLIQRRERE